MIDIPKNYTVEYKSTIRVFVMMESGTWDIESNIIVEHLIIKTKIICQCFSLDFEV